MVGGVIFMKGGKETHKNRANKFNNTFTNGNNLNCLICAVEQKLSHVHIDKTTKDGETQHYLIQALKASARVYKLYDECEETLTCDVKPQEVDPADGEYDKYCVK